MAEVPYLRASDIEAQLSWPALADALRAGHVAGPAPQIVDSFLYRGSDTMLSRAAWIDGQGVACKTVTALPGNAARGLSTVHGALVLFEDETGQVIAIVDSGLITKWKTAGDSLLGAQLLARPDSATLLILGAGSVSASLVEAYRSHWPDIAISIWNRTPARAEALAKATGAQAVTDLPTAVGQADIICGATMSTTPVLKGEWLSPGTHIDLIGAFKADMREADDETLRRARLFVDSRETTFDHIGELKIPLAEGTISEADIEADLYEMCRTPPARDPDDITLFKNGGGAHLDLMTARYMLEIWRGDEAG